MWLHQTTKNHNDNGCSASVSAVCFFVHKFRRKLLIAFTSKSPLDVSLPQQRPFASLLSNTDDIIHHSPRNSLATCAALPYINVLIGRLTDFQRLNWRGSGRGLEPQLLFLTHPVFTHISIWRVRNDPSVKHGSSLPIAYKWESIIDVCLGEVCEDYLNAFICGPIQCLV